MVADKLHLAAEGSSGNGSNSSSSRAVEVVFGCENMETGEIYKQRVDGVLGMGNNVNSLPRQVGSNLPVVMCARRVSACPGTFQDLGHWVPTAAASRSGLQGTNTAVKTSVPWPPARLG